MHFETNFIFYALEKRKNWRKKWTRRGRRRSQKQNPRIKIKWKSKCIPTFISSHILGECKIFHYWKNRSLKPKSKLAFSQIAVPHQSSGVRLTSTDINSTSWDKSNLLLYQHWEPVWAAEVLMYGMGTCLWVAWWSQDAFNPKTFLLRMTINRLSNLSSWRDWFYFN